MNSREFNILRHREPFQPFRVITVDGRAVDVVHPQLVMVLKDYVCIGIPREGYNEPIFEHLENVNYSDITKVEMLDADKALQTK